MYVPQLMKVLNMLDKKVENTLEKYFFKKYFQFILGNINKWKGVQNKKKWKNSSNFEIVRIVICQSQW